MTTPAPARRPEDEPDLSPLQREALDRVKALTTTEALDLLAAYQAIRNPRHRETLRKLARLFASHRAPAQP